MIQGEGKPRLSTFRPRSEFPGSVLMPHDPPVNDDQFNRVKLLNNLAVSCADRADEIHKDFCNNLVKMYTGELTFKDIFSSKRRRNFSTLMRQLFDRLISVCANVAMQYPLEICQLATREKTLTELVKLSDEDRKYFLEQLMFETASRVHKNHLQVWKDISTEF